MRVLVIGSGGREHALVWKIHQSGEVKKIFCAPGNAGIREQAELVPIGVEEIQKLADFATEERIDLTVVGPELPLTLGIADVFKEQGLRVFGPSRDAARLEGSKAFAKGIMEENGIPTADYATFTDARSASDYIAKKTPPFVVKADGLAVGKGVMICARREEAEKAINDTLVRKTFGKAGERVVIEE